MSDEEKKYFNIEFFALLDKEFKEISIGNGYFVNVNSFYPFIPDKTKLASYEYPAAFAIIYNTKVTRKDASGKPFEWELYFYLGIADEVSRENSTTDILNIWNSLNLYLTSKNNFRKVSASDMSYVSHTFSDVKIFNVDTEEYVEVQFSDFKVTVRQKNI